MKKTIFLITIICFISACAGMIVKKEDIPGNYNDITNGEFVPFKWFFMANPKAGDYLSKEIVDQYKGETAQIVGETNRKSSWRSFKISIGIGSLKDRYEEALIASGNNPNHFYVLKNQKSKQLFFIKKSDYEMYSYFSSNKLFVTQEDRRFSWMYDDKQFESVYNVVRKSKKEEILFNSDGVTSLVVSCRLLMSEFRPDTFYQGFIPRNYFFQQKNVFIQSNSFAVFLSKFKHSASEGNAFIYTKPISPGNFNTEGVFYTFGSDLVYFDK